MQGMKLGPALLKDAMLRTYRASEIAGIRELFVHAKNEEAKCFYEHFNFRPSPREPSAWNPHQLVSVFGVGIFFAVMIIHINMP